MCEELLSQKIILNPYGFSYLDFPPEIFERKDWSVITNHKNKASYPLELLHRIIFTDDFSKDSLLKICKNNFESSHRKLLFIPFSEETIQVSGFLNDYFDGVGIDYSHSLNFSDKYYMRTSLLNKINQPFFSKINSIQEISWFLEKYKNFSTYVLKPRNSSSAKDIKVFKEYKELNEAIDYENYIIENFVDYDTMLTTDGVYSNGNLLDFNIHEYGEKITDSLVHSNHATVNSTCHSIDNELYNCLKDCTHSVLNLLSSNNYSFPYHIEWFYSYENKKVTFCEGTARFGGAFIPELVKISQNKNMKHILWNNLFNIFRDNIPETFYLNKIACSFLGYRKSGKLVHIPHMKLNDLHWIHDSHTFVKINNKYHSTKNAIENSFFCTFESSSLEEYTARLSLLKNYQAEFIFENN